MQPLDENMKPLSPGIPSEFDAMTKNAKQMFRDGAKAIKVTMPNGKGEVIFERDYSEKIRSMKTKYQPHNGKRECARRMERKKNANFQEVT